MANFTITSNHYLRTIYSSNRDYATKSKRDEAPKSKLSEADAAALKKGLKGLADYDFEGADNDNSETKTDFYNRLKAFSDAYNNTMETGSSSQNSSMNATTKKIKNLSKQYASELSDYGITFDDKGYMKVAESAVKNISLSKYADVVGKDSAYGKELSKLATRMSRHIDTAV